jgi:hypothetical protein
MTEHDEEGQFSDAFENGDMARLHMLWFERSERTKAREKRERDRQSQWTIYAAYGSVVTAIIMIGTYIVKWIAALWK